jgi:hypothetical protein
MSQLAVGSPNEKQFVVVSYGTFFEVRLSEPLS